jgi:hypothetical protein
MKTTTKTHLLANGDYSTTANCRKEILAILRGIIVFFSVLKKQLYIYSVISRGFLADPVTMFSDTVGLRRTPLSKHWSRRRYEEVKENSLYRRQRRIIFTRVLTDFCGPNSSITVCTRISPLLTNGISRSSNWQNSSIKGVNKILRQASNIWRARIPQSSLTSLSVRPSVSRHVTTREKSTTLPWTLIFQHFTYNSLVIFSSVTIRHK